MSLRDAPRHVLLVQNFKETTGDRGQTKHTEPDGDPVKVRCNVYPVDAAESASYGLVNVDVRMAHIHFGGWPGNQYSRIEHKGMLWQQVGPVTDYDMGEGTSHLKVIITRTGTA